MSAHAKPSLGVVLLGAGASSRMGEPKLLLPWRGTTIIGHLLAQWQELGAIQIGLVMRAEDPALATELARLNFPQNDRIANFYPERGMFSSVLCAAHWNGWRADISHWAIVLGDQPHLDMQMLRELLACAAQNPGAICQPSFGGRLGHPAILPRSAFAELQYTGVGTLKEFFNLSAWPRICCPVADSGLLTDMDTPEDYQRLGGKPGA